MLKVLIWRVSNDTKFQDNALKILERQHDGIDVVGSSTGPDIGKVDWGGGCMMFFLSSGQDKSA